MISGCLTKMRKVLRTRRSIAATGSSPRTSMSWWWVRITPWMCSITAMNSCSLLPKYWYARLTLTPAASTMRSMRAPS